MKGQDHYRALERMYLAAPINEIFKPRIAVAKGSAEIDIAVDEKLYHAASAVHGSVYFKMLDDAAFFAANSLITDVFVLTVSFTVYLTRPVSEGRMRSVGTVVSRSRSQIIAESVVYNDREKEIGRGSGIFVKSGIGLADTTGYASNTVSNA